MLGWSIVDWWAGGILMDLSKIPDCRSPPLPRCLNHTHSSPTLLSKAAAHFLHSSEGREMSIIPQVGILIRCLWDRYSKTFFAFPIRFQGCINLLPRLLQCLLYVASTFPLLLLIKTMACSQYMVRICNAGENVVQRKQGGCFQNLRKCVTLQ